MTEVRDKRRSSMFKRCFGEDEEGENENQENLANNDSEVISKYIASIDEEEKQLLNEYKKVKSKALNMKKEELKTCKVTRSELFSMLSEDEKEKYKILFEPNKYTSLVDRLNRLNGKVAIVSLELNKITEEGNLRLVESTLQNNAEYENLMNRIFESREDSGLGEMEDEEGCYSESVLSDSSSEENVKMEYS